MKRSLLRTLPIEWYVLIFPFTVLAAALFVTHPELFIHLGGIRGLVMHLHSNFFSLMFYVVGWYFAVRLLYQWIIARLDTRSTTPDTPATAPTPRARLKAFFAITWIFFTYLFLMIALVILIARVYASADRETVRAFSMIYADWDMRVGGAGVYAHIIGFFDTYPFISYVIGHAYLGLPVILGAMGLILAATSTRMFREFMLAFFFIALFSIPFWHTAPSVSPSHYLREGVVGEVAPRHEALAEQTNAAVLAASAPYLANIDTLEAMWATREQAANSFAVSTNPSMHVAWGLLCVIYAFMLRRWLGWVLVGYQILNTIGTVFYLQHYLIDIPAGMALMVLVILISRALIAFEEAYTLVDRDQWFRGPAILQAETRANTTSFIRDMRSLRAKRHE